MRPYVVSCDLATLWREAGFVVPDTVLEGFRAEVKSALHVSVGSTEWISESELRDGLSDILANSSFPVVSLDRVYAPRALQINVTRLVDGGLRDAGYGTRDGIYTDLTAIVDEVAATIHERDIALVDDVVFSGAMMERIIDLFLERNIRVGHVFAGVAIGEGIERLRARNCSVTAVREYSEVTDEICERDFMPGAPLSGRTVMGLLNTGAPYVLPFGKPTQWASIPKNVEREFSRRVLGATADFYDSLGITCGELPRSVLGLRYKPNTLAADVLRAAIRRLE